MNNITAEEFRRATAMPRLTDVPDDFKAVLTPAAKKALKARDDAYNRFVDVEDEAQAAWIEADDAARRDTLALVEAVKNDQPDPGTVHEDKARRAVVVAVEKVRQAKQAVDQADRAWARHVNELTPAYLTVASQALRDATEAWQESLNSARDLMAQADDTLRQSYVGANFVRDFCRDVVLYQPPSNTPTIDWPIGMTDEVTYALHIADNIDRAAAHHGTPTTDEHVEAGASA